MNLNTGLGMYSNLEMGKLILKGFKNDYPATLMISRLKGKSGELKKLKLSVPESLLES